MLHVLPTSCKEGQRVEHLMPGLSATGYQLVVIKQLRRVLNDGPVRPVVLTQQDLTGIDGWV